MISPLRLFLDYLHSMPARKPPKTVEVVHEGGLYWFIEDGNLSRVMSEDTYEMYAQLAEKEELIR